MEIVDNYIDQEEFDKLYFQIISPQSGSPIIPTMGERGMQPLPWIYNSCIDFREKDVGRFQFVHTFYIKSTPTSQSINILEPILNKINPLALYRIKANLLTRTSNIVENTFHTDMGNMSEEKQKQWTTSIFYMNTNNGYTKFEDGTKVESIANRMITFPANMKHTGTSCTDEKIRVVINFNYYKEE